jgi:trk system potassium uptake protein TrkA
MKIMICGTGRIADELLKRFSENWDTTLIDKAEEKLGLFSKRFPSVNRVVIGDASSPVVLEEAGLEQQDYVIALTSDDRVNLAIVTFARDKRVKNVLALVHDPDMMPQFQELEVWTVLLTTVAARKIYQYLKDPRVNVIDLGQGEGEILELNIDEAGLNNSRAFMEAANSDWRLVGILRENRLIFPDDAADIEAGDRLLILGRSDLFKTFCAMVECSQPHFPLTYGQSLVLGLLPEDGSDKADLLREALYLAQNTKIKKIKVLCRKEACQIREQLDRWAESLDIQVLESEANFDRMLNNLEDAGVVVIPPLEPSLLKSLTKPVMIDLAHTLSCPLLVAKSTKSYEAILVPFNGSEAGERALEVAIDLAQQFDARLAAVIVEEPGYLHGDETAAEPWQERMLRHIRKMTHIHKIKIDEHLRKGNPVREILAIADQFKLIVIGSENREKDLFSPNVGDIIARKAPCSVLIVTK